MEPLQFQIIDILSDDISFNEENKWDKQFVLTFYGKTEEGLNIVCNVKDYKPYFYLRIPNNWTVSFVHDFLKIVQIYNYEKDIEINQYHNFYGFNYDSACKKIKKYYFAKIYFKSYSDLKKCTGAITKYYNDNLKSVINNQKKVQPKLKDWFKQDHNCDCKANLYESNIHPLLRFLHENNIESTGWIEVSDFQKNIVDEKVYHCDLQLDDLTSKNIQSIHSENISKMITASFDIECDSSHGDFPNPIKDFKKMAIDIHEEYFRQNIHSEFNSYQMKLKFIQTCIEGSFHNCSEVIQSVQTENGIYSDKSLKHIMKQFTVPMVQQLDQSNVKKDRDKMINILKNIFYHFENEKRQRIIVKGDPIIQIGMVFHRYGESECYDRSIVVIGNDILNSDGEKEKICDDIENVNVYECKDERELLLKWKDLLLYHNPDVVTGYNIFGFDFEYINKRMDHLFCNCCPKNNIFMGEKTHETKCESNQFYRLGRLMRNKKDKINGMDKLNESRITESYYEKNWGKQCRIISKKLSSSGLGDNVLKYIFMDGRVIFDVAKEIQKSHSLDSYKLDNVSAHFMKGEIVTSRCYKTHPYYGRCCIIETSLIGNLKTGDYITINMITKFGNMKYNNGQKYKIEIINHQEKKLLIRDHFIFFKNKENIKNEWCLAKDDVSPQQIFEFHKHGGPSGRAKIAKYCIMDCELCIHLLLLLDIIPNNMGMANVSSVPLSYIFLRGQGIKISSLVTKECSKNNIRIPTLTGLTKVHDEIKLYYHKNKKEIKDINKNIYFLIDLYEYKHDIGSKKSIFCKDIDEEIEQLYLDFKLNINENIKEFIIGGKEEEIIILSKKEIIILFKKEITEIKEWKKDNIWEELINPKEGFEGAVVLEPETGLYLEDPISVLDFASLYPNSICEKNISHETYICSQKEIDENPDKFQWIFNQEFPHTTITYDDYHYEQKGKTVHKIKADTQTTCYFVNKEVKCGIIPTILSHLLDQRKKTRKLIKQTDDENKKKVLDGLQLAYKVTANSVYGQTGARTSSISFKKLAACTTAVGRQRIYDAKDGVLEWAENEGYNKPHVIYGDTDSVFIKFSRYHHETNELLVGKDALKYCIDCGIKSGKWITEHKMNLDWNKEKYGDGPQDLEYEKTFYPFILMSKKKYTGDKYEYEADKPKERTSMGNVMKRRDNAAIVKYVYGNVIEIIMKEKNIDKAMVWLDKTLLDILNGNVHKDMFIISKSLSAYYKNPQGIAHKVLADRMAERNPGNKPKPNDRIPYMFRVVDETPIHNGYYKNGKEKLKKRNILQGDRIEHPDYMEEKNIKIDYKYYISNQIMNPVKEILDIEKDENETDIFFEKFLH